MTRPRAYLELFAGGAACALALMGGAAVVPPVGYMGGKRKLAPAILGAAGLRVGEGAERLLLVDAGEWGGVWEQVVLDGRGLADRLLTWEGRDPSDLWRDLAAAGRPDDPQERAAAYLWLQGRAASCTPVWWDADGSTTMARSASSGGGEQRVWQAGLVMPDPPRGGDCTVRPATERGEKLIMATGNGRRSGVCDAVEAHRLVMPSNGAHGPGLIRAHEKPARLVMADKPGRPAQRAQEMHPGPYGEAVERSREPKEKGRRSVGSGIMRPATVAHRIIKAQAALLSGGGRPGRPFAPDCRRGRDLAGDARGPAGRRRHPRPALRRGDPLRGDVLARRGRGAGRGLPAPRGARARLRGRGPARAAGDRLARARPAGRHPHRGEARVADLLRTTARAGASSPAESTPGGHPCLSPPSTARP